MALNKTMKWEGRVTKETLPVRKKPNAKAEETSFSPLTKNTRVNVCDTSSGWYYVEIEGMYGFVSAKYVVFDEPDRIVPSKKIKWIGETTVAVRCREWASKYAPLTSFSPIGKGASVSVCDTIDGWYYVRYAGKYCFVPQKYVKYVSEPKDITPATFLKSVKAVQEKARKNGWIYADSQSKVPCADKKISCDRLIARALWDLGFTDQPKGGIAFRNDFDKYYRKFGFKKSTSMDSIRAGSIVVVMNPSRSSRHMFVVASRKGNTFTRYDCGSNEWIKSKQPLPGLWMSSLIAVYNL